MSLMVLGTASHVGKSVTVAAICRSLVRRNISVAPFKSQNMSNNSYVTAAGREIGMAQAMQAHAACTEPHADMNPVLLKPKGDRTSQVVLLGRPYRDVYIGDYYKETGMLLEEAVLAFRRLEERYGQVVVEGAGGAAELNLYDRDIANILLARRLQLPIILVGDIERGGIFAQIYGTIALLPDDVRPLVAGVIVNKFRGDPSLFEEGIARIEAICGVPVIGVVPYADMRLPSEDSLSIDDKRHKDSPVQIAILRLPRISNFTDFELLEQRAAVEYVDPGTSLEAYDCIIIPGTKNTVEDLAVLRRCGTGEELSRARMRNIPIIGICGGYQMLGREITDTGIEGGNGEFSGFGLLDVTTRFDGYHKTTVQVEREAAPVSPILSEMGRVRGYEIHMGETLADGVCQAFEGEGAVSDDGLVFGTYMHGLFVNENAIDALLSYLYRKKGLVYSCDADGPCEGQDCSPYDALADHYERHCDMDYIVSFFKHEGDTCE